MHRPEVFDDPVLGQSRPTAEMPKRCSLCMAVPPQEGDTLLIIQGRFLWCYCPDHAPDGPVLEAVRQRAARVIRGIRL